MGSVFQRLGYNFPESEKKANNTDIVVYSQSTQNAMNAIPKFVSQWQYDAIANSTLTGWTQNPTKSAAQSISLFAQQIEGASINVSGLSGVETAANLVISSANSFIAHGDRLAGLVAPDANTANLPHLETALATGKAIAYITNQSDGIINNSPIMGSFTSVTITAKEVLSNISTNLASWPAIVNSSIYISDPLTGAKSSNLTSEQITYLTGELSNASTFMTTRRTHDEKFFANSVQVMNDFNYMQKFTANTLGQTETNLYYNTIGTNQLITNLNADTQNNTTNNVNYNPYTDVDAADRIKNG